MKKRTQVISDEEILAALLSSGTVREAASAAGLPIRTLYDRMNTPDFQIMYREARAEILRAAVHNMNAQIQEAVNTIAGIMTNEEINPATRLNAAQTLLSNAAKFSARLQVEERSIQFDRDNVIFRP
jgi:predicted DNA-binding ArsR family transcriptional regulator